MNNEALEIGADFTPRFDKDGLIPTIAQHFKTNEVLMLAYMNQASLDKTIQTKQAHYYSRSRNEIWLKGETSGQIQIVKSIRTDCDQDAILLLVDPQGDGGCCHVGYFNCFYREIDDEGNLAIIGQKPQ